MNSPQFFGQVSVFMQWAVSVFPWRPLLSAAIVVSIGFAILRFFDSRRLGG